MTPVSRLLPLLPLLALPLAAQQLYPLDINQDALTGPADFSFLNHPLEPQDTLFVRDGHFFTLGPDLTPFTDDDARIRLFGMNLAFGANFPTPEDAPRIARRLRRLGVNLVRLHHMDSQPDSNPANANSLLTTGPYPTFNETALARLRNFLLALKSEGIYANLNLHVGYTFRPSIDNIPTLPSNAAFPNQSKPLHILHPRLVQLQADFVRGLFQRLDLRGDPVLALVELDNETSLLYAHQNGSLETTALGEYKTSLHSSWNRYLRARYASNDDLRAAWGPSTPEGPDILPSTWRPLEIHAPAAATLTTLDDGTVRVLVATAAPSGAPTVILKKTGFSATAQQPYVAEVEIRADLPAGQSRNIYWDIKQDVSPWTTAIGKNIAVTSQWQRVRMPLTPSFSMDSIGRFGLSLEKCEAAIYVRNARLSTGGQRGADPSDDLDAANIALPSSSENTTTARINDYLDFLAFLDRDYNQVLLDSTREFNSPLLPVTGTQMGFGGLMLLDAQRNLDFYDQHFYIDHYAFPNTPWDGRDWSFKDDSSIAAAWSTFTNTAAARVSARPYTVSEYNQPWPNTRAAEIGPTLAAYGSFQDWDAIVHFAYEHSRTWDAGVPHGFNLNGDWTKLVNTGQSALLFRLGLLAPDPEPLRLPAHEDLRRQFTRDRRNGSFNAAYNSYFGYQSATAIARRVELDPEATGLPEEAKQPPPDTIAAATGEFEFDRINKRFLLHAPQAAGLFGNLAGAPVTAGPLTAELAPTARGAANILLTALDGKPLAESTSMLLTNPGYTLRTQPNSNPARTQNIINYPGAATFTLEPDQSNKPSGDLNAGKAPISMEAIDATVTLNIPGPLEVYALDGNGDRLSAIPVETTETGHRFQIGGAPWYELYSPGRQSGVARRSGPPTTTKPLSIGQ